MTIKRNIKKLAQETKSDIISINKDAGMVSCQYTSYVYYRTIQLNTLGKFKFAPHDPFDLFIFNASTKIQKIERLRARIRDSKKKKNGHLTKTGEKMLDEMLMELTMLPILIISALETMTNHVIFQDRFRVGEQIKEEMQRWVPLEEKLFKVLPKITYHMHKKEFDELNFKETFNKIKIIRNKIVHSKRKTKEGDELIAITNELLDIDWNRIIEDVQKFARIFEFAHVK